MAYPRDMLNDDEEIVFDHHPHWSYMIGPMVMVGLGFLVFIIIAIVNIQFAWVGLIVIALLVFGSIGRYLRWQTTEFVLTSRRLVVRQGIISKSGIEIPLDRVMNISYRQAWWERILGTGDLVVESAGSDGRQHFTDVAHPARVQNLIYKTVESDSNDEKPPQKDGLKGDGTPKQSLPHHESEKSKRSERSQQNENHGLSVPEQIEKMAELRDRGVLSEEEFQHSKRELLEDL